MCCSLLGWCEESACCFVWVENEVVCLSPCMYNNVFHVGRIGCLFFAMLMSLCVDVMVMSFMYVISFTGACGVGLSDVYMLKSVGDRSRLVDVEMVLFMLYSDVVVRRVVAFEAMLCGDVWDVVCDVWE